MALALLFISGMGFAALGACGDVEVPPFPDGQGQTPPKVSYPGGPYGVAQGQIITNYDFQGFPDPLASSDPNTVQEIQLSDFYNPSGDELFPDGSPYGAGQPKPKALLIDIGARWCSPCQQEAAMYLPGEYETYHPQGAEFLFVMAEGAIGVPGVASDLSVWVKKYKIAYPSVIDPQRSLTSSFSASSFPVNILVDTRTMTIVDSKNGIPDETFFDEIAMVLAK